MPESKVERAGKVIGVVLTSAIAVAQYLLLSRGATKPVHFAMYLLGQTWIELLVLTYIWVCYHVGAFAFRKYHSVISDTWESASIALVRSGVVVPCLAIGFFTVITLDHLYYLARARVFFWAEASRKAYVHQYETTIDGMAEVGRITDALNLSSLVIETLGTNTEAGYLTENQQKMTAIVARSNELVQVERGNAWNPVTDRTGYFRLLEALHVNPQNYVAADTLKPRIPVLEKWIKEDSRSICASNGVVASLRLHVASFQEAKWRWQEVDSTSTCTSSVTGVLLQSWLVTEARCLVAVSDWTRTPFDFAHRTDNQPSCAVVAMGRADMRDNPEELEQSERESRRHSWYRIDFLDYLKEHFTDKGEPGHLRGGALETPASPEVNSSPDSSERLQDQLASSAQEDSTSLVPDDESPIAFVRIGNHIKLMDGRGRITELPLAGVGSPRYSFPVLSGVSVTDSPERRADRVDLYRRFMAELSSSGSGGTQSISEVDVTDPTDLKALVSLNGSDFLVHFGHNGFIERFRSFQTRLPEWRKRYPDLESADMRYEGHVVLGMRSNDGGQETTTKP